MDSSKPGVFHQDNPGNAEIFDGVAIESPHFNSCWQFHDNFLKLSMLYAKE
jgi:hypothetical protein